MTTTDPILAHLEQLRAEHEDAGRLVEARRVDQQLIAVRTLARLAEERAAAEQADDRDAVAAVDAQAQFWVRQVDLAELEAAAAGEQGGTDARRRAPLAAPPDEEEDTPPLPGGAAKSSKAH
ncbi:hypothetical protein O7622_01225 [Micromonospora sp. WMMD1076]|uniref:hypothetical protein n=1 Tax=Micromonospora sp. WMMD1076 TaxID=3016103 RepID=UPI00249BEC6A|nr:hypothetical protein [Micromonospora sp. WMMD1076]WFF07252.1 hypothetical protein O7622_01225 [Micromonospora sp. WMMD1076]